MCLGCISAFGLSVVANFQETNVFRVHMIGAMLAFGFGVMYAWSQTYMSFKMIRLVNTKSMAFFRLFLSILMTCTFTTSSICGPMAFRQFNGKDPTNWRRKFVCTVNLGGFLFTFCLLSLCWSLTLSVELRFAHLYQFFLLKTIQPGTVDGNFTSSLLAANGFPLCH